MRAHIPEKLEGGRVRSGLFATSPEHGPYGEFHVQGPCGCELCIIVHPRQGWEHVSVSTGRRRTPNWEEMCFVKDLFWDEEERVMQLHPPLSEYVKNNRYCLHLWKPLHQEIPAPPAIFVGIVGLGPHETYVLLESMTAEMGNNHKLSEQIC
jgi:hypothetical protein